LHPTRASADRPQARRSGLLPRRAGLQTRLLESAARRAGLALALKA